MRTTRFGIVDPTFLGSLTDANGDPCVDSNGNPIAAPCTTLAPFDLTRGGTLFPFNGHTDIKLLSLYAQDSITKGNWSLNLGLRGDFYNGLSIAQGSRAPSRRRLQHQENQHRSSRFVRARSRDSVQREPGALQQWMRRSSSQPAAWSVLPIGASLPSAPAGATNSTPACNRLLGATWSFPGNTSGSTPTMLTTSAVLGATPITFPIEWHNSKIPGVRGTRERAQHPWLFSACSFSRAWLHASSTRSWAARAQLRRLRAQSSASITTRNLTRPLTCNISRGSTAPGSASTGDTTAAWSRARCPAQAVTATTAPPEPTTVVDVSGISPNQQFQAGLFCGAVHAPPTPPTSVPISVQSLPGSQYGSTLVSVPAPGTENDDHNPPRVAPRHLFDLSVGDDNLFRGDKYKWSLQLTAINITNRVALYNFLSTFSGHTLRHSRIAYRGIGFPFLGTTPRVMDEVQGKDDKY